MVELGVLIVWAWWWGKVLRLVLLEILLVWVWGRRCVLFFGFFSRIWEGEQRRAELWLVCQTMTHPGGCTTTLLGKALLAQRPRLPPLPGLLPLPFGPRPGCSWRVGCGSREAKKEVSTAGGIGYGWVVCRAGWVADGKVHPGSAAWALQTDFFVSMEQSSSKELVCSKNQWTLPGIWRFWRVLDWGSWFHVCKNLLKYGGFDLCLHPARLTWNTKTNILTYLSCLI